MRRALLGAILAAATTLACSNAGEDRLLAVSSTGIFKGLIYFDLDGDRVATAAGDDSVRNMTVRLVTLGGDDTVASATSAISGLFRVAGVPVGTYRVVLDTTPLADTATIAQQDSLQVTILPGDSIGVIIGVSYPHVSIRAARTPALFPLGRKVFVEGVVLNAPFNFRDTIMHVQDTSAAIRATRVLATGAQAADSVRLRGTISIRNGQRTLDVVTVFIQAAVFLPPSTQLTTAQAASADGGTRDAQQISVLNVTITDTVTVSPDCRLTVNDSAGTGVLQVILDPSPAAFGNVIPPCVGPGFPWTPGKRFDIVGLAVPSLTPGIWLLKPRSSTELVQRSP